MKGRILTAAAFVALSLGSPAAAQERFWESEGNIENTAPPNVPTVSSRGEIYPGALRQNDWIVGDDQKARWEAAKTKPTPRINGKPDLSGHWIEATFLAVGYPEDGFWASSQTRSDGASAFAMNARGGTILTMETDSYLWRRADADTPLYKPEYWSRIRELDLNALREDGQYRCKSLGVPRMFRPNYSMLKGHYLALLYTPGDNRGYMDEWRLVRLNQPHDQQRLDDQTPYGDSVATWDGDTLVIDTRGMSDETWLWSDGLLHSTETRVIERIKRVGDTVTYDMTVEDPQVLQKPWVRATRFYTINNDPTISLPRSQVCEDRNALKVPGGWVH